MYIRLMKIDDIECVKDVYVDVFFAENKENVVSYVLGYTTPDLFQGRSVYIENLAVITEFQNKGKDRGSSY